MSAEVVDLVPVENTVTLFGSNDPTAIVTRATAVAKPLANVIKDRNLFANIKGRRHVMVEGWTLLGTMLGVFPVCTWTRKLDDGWEARVEARTLHGEVVGAAESQCTRSESTWKSRDDFALRSMAQTRATAKALRLPLGFIMSLAGYDATPLEEMPHDTSEPSGPRSAAPSPSAHTGRTTSADRKAEPDAGSARKGSDEPSQGGQPATDRSSPAAPPPLMKELDEAIQAKFDGKPRVGAAFKLKMLDQLKDATNDEWKAAIKALKDSA